MNERLQQVMASAFEVPLEQIKETSSQDTVENWDSLHHIKMIVYLEREFNITIPDDKVGNMISYKLVEAVVNGCLTT